MNKVILAGWLGQNVKYTKFESEKELTMLRLATKTGYGDKAVTEWHNVECWGTLAKQCSDFLSKGDKVLVEGSIKTYEWEDRDGTKRAEKRILAYNVEFMKTSKKVPTTDSNTNEEESQEAQFSI